jgi:hypothetical protein
MGSSQAGLSVAWRKKWVIGMNHFLLWENNGDLSVSRPLPIEISPIYNGFSSRIPSTKEAKRSKYGGRS